MLWKGKVVIGMTVVLGKVMPWKGKVAIGMMGETEKVMLEKGKVAIGMTGELGKVMPWKGKVAIGMTAAALHTPKRKKQEMTCAEPPLPAPNCRAAHVKKKKARNGVCGAAPAGSKLPHCTRQKEKSKK